MTFRSDAQRRAMFAQMGEREGGTGGPKPSGVSRGRAMAHVAGHLGAVIGLGAAATGLEKIARGRAQHSIRRSAATVGRQTPAAGRKFIKAKKALVYGRPTHQAMSTLSKRAKFNIKSGKKALVLGASGAIIGGLIAHATKPRRAKGGTY
jgi:hypothetical protein